ncbi:hypothetical protein ACI2LC_33760 [Nonomuraea wenchangensis]|uniref:hypothetical protein n=1 Tax=Nonomuraea wenchangensis TaxID=568860 RepID=UPI0033EB6600
MTPPPAFRDALSAAAAAGPLAGTAWTGRSSKQYLDLGAQNLLHPMIDTAEQARRAAAAVEGVAADVAILARGSEHLARIAAGLVSGPG